MRLDASLLRLIEGFIYGEDISIKAANAIELALHDMFPADDRAQELVEMLASYRPGGGEFLYDEMQVRSKLEAFLRVIGPAADSAPSGPLGV